MADAAVDLLLGKLVSALENEASHLGGVRDELDDLKHELLSMKAFLEDAGKNNLQSSGEKNWVESVRKQVYEVEDIIHEFTYHVNRQKRFHGRVSRFLHQSISTPKNLWVTHQTASKIQQIKKSIKGISERTVRYGINRIERATSNDDNNRLLNLRESSRFIEENNLVGIKEERQLLKTWLMDEEPNQVVISVVGMGGSGKTTLVSKIHNDENVKHNFDCYAWITVSQTYATIDLFKSMIKEFYKEKKELVPAKLSDMGYNELVEMLRSYLKLKRYLLVLDDVWDTSVWREIKASLPDNRLGSRIILTTRRGDVADFNFGVKSHVLNLKPLEKSEAWTLFCMKAFSSEPEKACPTELERLARELVDRCEGLPLAIVALGGVMSSKKLLLEWCDVCNNLNWQLSNNPNLTVVNSILLLSFNDLPCHLKQCFLYCCLFPEDYLIRRKRLIKLWIAEGFVQEVNRITPEQVAESYLSEFIFRSMLQVVMRNESGRPKACKMHDLMRELALLTSEREKFCAVYDGRVTIEECGARRLSIQTIEGGLKSYGGMSQLRSLLVFATGSPSIINTLLSKLKLLTVLDLEDSQIVKLPDELKILFNLRYLNLKRTRVAELPKSIGRLFNLQTLDIVDTLIKELPREVGKLHNLWHLQMYRYDYTNLDTFRCISGTRVPFKISQLKKLQSTSVVVAEGDIIRQLGSMTQLTSVGLSNVRGVDEMDLCSSLINLKLLRRLFLMAINEEDSLPLDALSSAPPQLRFLCLNGKLERVPVWFCTLQCIQTLMLMQSSLHEDVLPHIAELPNLTRLVLVNACHGKKLHFLSGFPKLRRLGLNAFPRLTQIVIEKGALPELQRLGLEDCMGLDSLPQGIEHLTNLQELELTRVSNYLINSIRGEQSTDRLKVRHKPKISTSSGFYDFGSHT